MEFRKIPTEAEIIDRLNTGSMTLLPAKLLPLLTRPLLQLGIEVDGSLSAEWQEKRASYIFEFKASSSRMAFDTAMWRAKQAAEQTGLLPMIIVPYLGSEALCELEARQISGIDLCGNGLLIAPDFRIWRSGAPNVFKDSRPIRNPYRGDSSIFARCFLLRREFGSLGELQVFARERTFADQITEESALSLATASKVVGSLEEEMVVARQGGSIRLTDPRRLLDLLRAGTREPRRQCVVGKTPLTPVEVWNRLSEMRRTGALRSVATGLASAERYRVLVGNDKLSLFVDDISAAAEALRIQPGRPFANIEVWEETKNVVYFDARTEGDTRWASPVQTWLELAFAGPRERQAASAMESMLLSSNVEVLP